MDNEYPCYKCDKIFNTKYNLNRHLKRKIPCNKNKEFKCDICLKNFACNQTLENHKKKKYPCKPPDLELLNNTIVSLKNQNQSLQINNNTNNTNNSHNNITYNTNIIVAQEQMKNHINSNCYTLNDIQKLVSNEHIYDYLELATVDKDYDEDDVLQNTKDISLLIKYVFCNVDLQENFIFFKDFIENQIYVRLNEEMKELSPFDINYIIYVLFKQLLTYNNLDSEMRVFFRKFIKKYDNQEFRTLDKKEVKEFVKKIKNDLNLSLIELYDDIKNYKKEKFTLLHEKNEKFKKELEKNKLDRQTKLLEEDTKISMKYTKDILSILLNLFKDINSDEDYKFQIISKTYFNEDIKYIKLISYFINDLYISNSK